MGVKAARFGVIVGTPLVLRAADGAGGPPSEFEILPFPIWKLTDITLITDELSQQRCVENFRAMETKLVIDYEHQTMTGDRAPAAGWIREVVAAGQRGLRARNVEWTPQGAEYLRNREYDYQSPVILYERDTLRVIAVHSVALTNTPRTVGQTPLSEQIAAKAIAQFEATSKEGTMKELIAKFQAIFQRPVIAASMKDLRVLLAAAVAMIPEDDVQIEAKTKEFEGSPKTLAEAFGLIQAKAEVSAGEILELLELPKDAKRAAVQAKVLSLQHPADVVPRSEHDRVVAELKAKSQETAKTAIDQLIAANKKKLPPPLEAKVRKIAERDGLDAAKELVAELPDQLPAQQAAGSAPETPQAPSRKSVRIGAKELAVSEESEQLVAKIQRFQKEKSIKTYNEAARRFYDEQPAVN